MTALTIYHSNAASVTLSSANKLYTVLGTPSTAQSHTQIDSSTGWGEIYAQGRTGAWPALGAIGSPSGHGFFLDTAVLDGQRFPAANWSGSSRVSVDNSGTVSGTLVVRGYRYHAGVYTNIITFTITGLNLTNAIVSQTLPATLGAQIDFAAGDRYYEDYWFNATANTSGAGQTLRLNRLSTDTSGLTGDTNVGIVTPGFSPITSPTLSTSPTGLTFTAVTGTGNPATQNSVLSETSGIATNWTSATVYGSGSGWLSFSPTSGSLLASGTVTIVFTALTGALSPGTYTATVTFTATTGGATATVLVTFTVTSVGGLPVYSIKLASQDITLYVDQLTIEVDDTLGQGAGAGGGEATQGRAATFKFNTSLGPANLARGAGQTIPPGGPWLVRQGEVVITDATGTVIFGGYATKLTDTTTAQIGQTKQNFTTVEGIDYSTSLQRTIISESFTGQTDVQIIRFVMQKYAPWVNLAYLPATGTYTFALRNFRNRTVEQVLQSVASVTGYLVFVDYLKNLRYISPTLASSAPFNLDSSPNFTTTFPHFVESFVTDDNSVINRVRFYGGTKLSNNISQDLSPLANGTNKIFPLAYYPSPTTDGNYHVLIGVAQQVVGNAGATGTANQLISAGGTANVLIDPGSRTLTFDVAPATVTSSANAVTAQYRYNFPLSLVLTDEGSHDFFGTYLDGTIDDNTVFDNATAIQRCKVLLSQQSYGLVSLKVGTYRAGAQAGMLIHVTNPLRGLNGTYLIQNVQIEPLGSGNFLFHLSLGAWNWNLIDFLLKLPTLAAFGDNTNDTTETVIIQQVFASVVLHDAWSNHTSVGPYYARATPSGDGHDSFPGFATIASNL